VAPRLSAGDVKRVKDLMKRARDRIDGAAAAVSRERIEVGEFDNHFDGVVTAIFHVVDAVELTRTGVHRRVGEADEATLIRSVVATLVSSGVPDVPAAARLVGLNADRNASVHGHWTNVLDRDALEVAIAAARQLHAAGVALRGAPGCRPQGLTKARRHRGELICGD